METGSNGSTNSPEIKSQKALATARTMAMRKSPRDLVSMAQKKNSIAQYGNETSRLTQPKGSISSMKNFGALRSPNGRNKFAGAARGSPKAGTLVSSKVDTGLTGISNRISPPRPGMLSRNTNQTQAA